MKIDGFISYPMKTAVDSSKHGESYTSPRSGYTQEQIRNMKESLYSTA